MRARRVLLGLIITASCLAASAVPALAVQRTGELVGSGHYTSDRSSARSACPADARATGVRIGLDDRGFVDFVVMICRRAGRGVSARSRIGYPAFPPLHSSSCQEPAAPVGIYGYTGDIVDGVGIRCQEVSSAASDGSLVRGGGGANRGDFDCPSGTFLNGVTGVDAVYFGGPVVSGLRGLCAAAAAPRTSRPTSCSALLVQDPGAPDGTYTINVAGHRFPVYCRNMQRARQGLVPAPSQYISLPATGASENVSEYAAGGASPGTNVTTAYTKIRVNPYPESISPLTFSVQIADQTFSRSSGRLCHSHASTPCPGASAVRSMPYATAFSCDPGGPSGHANIDLTGTPFAVVNSFTAQGADPVGTAKFLSPQVVNLSGSGYCGWEAPAVTYNPFDRSPLQDARRGYDLEIRFDPAAAPGRPEPAP